MWQMKDWSECPSLAVLVFFCCIDILSCVLWEYQHNMENGEYQHNYGNYLPLFCMYIASFHLVKIHVFKHLTKKTGPGKWSIAIAVLNKQTKYNYFYIFFICTLTLNTSYSCFKWGTFYQCCGVNCCLKDSAWQVFTQP